MKSGIYSITNRINGNKYIGSSRHVFRRWSEHLSNLRKGLHHCGHLQNSYNKYGEENFVFQIIELCSPENMIEIEQFYLDTFKPEYNSSPTAKNVLGIKRSPETIERMRISQLGKKLSKEHKEKIGNSMKGKGAGRRIPVETRQKISLAAKGRVGIVPSKETRRKMSESKKRYNAMKREE